MKRVVDDQLDAWLGDPNRKPLVLRGARQVGKTWSVRALAKRASRDLIELNFERDPGLKRHFEHRDPRKIVAELSIVLGRTIEPGKSVLFLDEIQSAGKVLAGLRWFREEWPELPVIAAGSLLEFALTDGSYSMPVGRVSFRHMEPMGLVEYLSAHGQDSLVDALSSWRPGQEFSPAAHEKASGWFDRYAMVGGMPELVNAEVEGGGPSRCRELQMDLAATYRADFAKYSGRMERDLLDSVLRAVAGSIGSKFVYARAGDGVKQHQARKALELLASARICHLVRCSPGDGLPLGAGASDRHRKAILGDVGLIHALAGTPAGGEVRSAEYLSPSIRARIAEQLAGQQIRLMGESAGDGPELFYWQRDGGRPGEIDYLVEMHGRVVPVEIKSGASGTLKSLHQFMFDRKLEVAVRCDSNPPSVADLRVKTTQGNAVNYRLVSLPHYLLWLLPRILS